MKSIRLHFSYLVSFKSFIILFLSIAVLFVFFLKVALECSSLALDEAKRLYFMQVVFLIQILVYFTSIYFYCNSFNCDNLSYYSFVISEGRVKFLLCKIMSLIIIMLFYVMLLIIGFVTIGMFCINNYSLSTYIIIGFLKIFLLSEIYGMIAGAAMLYLQNSYVFIVVVVVSMLSVILEDYKWIIIPNNNLDLYNLLMIFCVLTFVIVYSFKHLNLKE